MKTENKMKSVLGLLLSIVCLACGAGCSERVYMRIQDEDGAPVAGADVDASWVFGIYPGPSRTKRKVLKSDEKGCLDADRYVHVDDVRKAGYAFHRYLNAALSEPMTPTADTREHPRVIVLRKKETQTSCVLRLGGGCKCDIFERNKRCLQTPHRKSAEVELFGNARRELKLKSVPDFRVTGIFDPTTRIWRTEVMALEGCAGLCVSTRRRYVAPETGYVSRVAISQNDYNNESCTLYVKLKSPDLFAMVPLGSRCSDELASVRIDERYPLARWRFSYREAVVNPYGGRVFEENEVAAQVRGGFHWDMIKSILVKGFYPPHPDLNARLEALTADTRLGKLNSELERKMRQLENRQDACVKARKYEEARQLQIEIDACDRRCDEIVDERKMWMERYGSLNLPSKASVGKP